MTDRPSDLRDRRSWVDDARDEGAAIAARSASTPISGRTRRRRMGAVVLVFCASLLAGGAMSAIPRPEREVTQMVRRPGGPRRQTEEMRLAEQAYGFPFRTWIVQKGPAEATVRTYAHVEAKPHGVIFNVVIAALAGLLILFTATSRKRRDQAK
jgi:hypothetical protein